MQGKKENLRNKSIKPLVGDNVMVDILMKKEKRKHIRNFGEKEPAYKTGCGKCRSGNDSVCRRKNQIQI